MWSSHTKANCRGFALPDPTLDREEKEQTDWRVSFFQVLNKQYYNVLKSTVVFEEKKKKLLKFTVHAPRCCSSDKTILCNGKFARIPFSYQLHGYAVNHSTISSAKRIF